ncbi:MAG: hypothetical protein AB7C91_06535 [Sphaerochaeta sp.]|uniref:hypothetical protein n=1 Tax=Sphaerochaeta sp. TaxID=1972642 RepID=UPI003D0F4A9E
MHDLIERYINQTVKKLNPKDREEVAKELEANILDMLGPNEDEHTIEQTLLSLGSPSKLADTYRLKRRYLIGPETFDFYWMVLRIVCLVITIVTTSLTLLTIFLSPQLPSVVDIIVKIVTTIFSALSASFLWVTITFALLDYFQVKTDTEAWDLKALRSLEAVPTRLIKRTESIVDLAGLSVFFVLLLAFYLRPQLLAVYRRGWESMPVFITGLVRPYLIGWMGVTLITLSVAVIKLHQGNWTPILFSLSAFCDLLGVLYFIFLINRSEIYNPEFFSIFSGGMPTWQTIAKAASIALLLLTLVSIADDAYSTFKRTRLNESVQAPAR